MNLPEYVKAYQYGFIRGERVSMKSYKWVNLLLLIKYLDRVNRLAYIMYFCKILTFKEICIIGLVSHSQLRKIVAGVSSLPDNKHASLLKEQELQWLAFLFRESKEPPLPIRDVLGLGPLKYD